MDQYGNPVKHHHTAGGGTTGDDYGTNAGRGHGGTTGGGGYGAATGGGYGAGTGDVGYGGAGAGAGAGAGYGETGSGTQQQPKRPTGEKEQHGILHRSGSSGSSSSEDDGEGGRRKKGLTEKIKEKLPGGHKTEEERRHQVGTGTATGPTAHGYGGQGGVAHQPEKKGIVDKIQEKLPGGGHKTEEERSHQVGTGTATGPTAHGYGGQGGVAHQPEKKGIVDKIQEKLPGGGHKTEEERSHQVGTGTATGPTAHGYGGQGGVAHEPEKKGIMEKVKEKLPGHH